jgi:hypothetical protein
MCFVSEIEAVTTTGVFQRVRAVDEKDSVVNVVFLAEFGNERLSKNTVRGRFKRCMEYSCVIGSTAAYSQYCSSLSRITISSTAK